MMSLKKYTQLEMNFFLLLRWESWDILSKIRIKVALGSNGFCFAALRNSDWWT
jgi:hypothetical protein